MDESFSEMWLLRTFNGYVDAVEDQPSGEAAEFYTSAGFVDCEFHGIRVSSEG
jgi:hypothetical protein